MSLGATHRGWTGFCRALAPTAPLAALALLLGGCRPAAPGAAPDSGPLRIVVSIAPLAGIVKDLAPEAEVTVLVPPGSSLHTYEVTPSDIVGLGRADIVVYVGLALDPKVIEFLASHPSKDRTDVCFADVAGVQSPDGHDHDEHAGHAHEEHEHAADAEHDDGEPPIDQHLWLDPSLVSRLVPAVRRAVEDAHARRGGLSDAESQRLAAAEAGLLTRIAEIDREYADRLGPLAGRAIVTHHDAFRRIADRYGLEIAAVIRTIESSEPTPGAIAAAAEAVTRRGARAVFFEPQFDPASARRIAEAAGVRLGQLNPEGDTDWFRLMRQNLDSLVTNLSD